MPNPIIIDSKVVDAKVTARSSLIEARASELHIPKPSKVLSQNAIELNQTLLALSKNGVVTGATLRKMLPNSSPTPLTVLPPGAHVIVYPLRVDQKERLDQLSSMYPDPRANQIRRSEALLATAPQKVLDLTGITPTEVPPPSVLVQQQDVGTGWFLDHWRMFTLVYEVIDIDGILSCYVDVNNTTAPTMDYRIQTYNGIDRHPCDSKQFLSIALSPGNYSGWISAQGISGKKTTQSFDFSIENPPPPSPTSEYDARTIAMAKAWNVPNDTADSILKAAYAINAASWDVTWYGSIEVVLEPDVCKWVAALASAVATYAGNNFRQAIFGGPWYAILIWGLILADALEVSGILGACAANNKQGKLCWNAILGIFYAIEA
jgi:hypothetical protein